ncbi:unnamed protein product [Nyctereutes procyonoides]|uniref:(raccoon dog) hypothetical protein n=1 Tax=Nyctereutes procyonoides TaxID=34880 RepID=A0A811YLY6_NYCPR|nr:unnamed protein product [Nyctereutes procyonoides]
MQEVQNIFLFLQRVEGPFADASKGDDLLPVGTEDCIHVRFNREMKFVCNGTVTEHPEYEEIIQLKGDQHKNMGQLLLETGQAKDDQLKVHGF